MVNDTSRRNSYPSRGPRTIRTVRLTANAHADSQATAQEVVAILLGVSAQPANDRDEPAR